MSSQPTAVAEPVATGSPVAETTSASEPIRSTDLPTFTDSESNQAVDSQNSEANGKNASSDADSNCTGADVQELKQKILKQVEYYFGDANLPNDRHLLREKSKDSEGWVTLDYLMTFNRMKPYTDRNLVVEALRESKELLQVSEDGSKVRRAIPLQQLLPIPAKVKQGPMWKSIYVKGFDEDKEPTEAAIRKFFEQYGNIRNVKLRKSPENKFKGSVFVEFSTHEQAFNVTQMKLEYEGRALTIMMKFDYCEMKVKEKGLDPNSMRYEFAHEHGNRGDRDSKQDDRRRNGHGDRRKVSNYKKSNSRGGGDYKPDKRGDSHTVVARFQGAGDSASWRSVRNELRSADVGKVSFVQYDTNERTGYIEFEQPWTEAERHKLLHSNILFDGTKPTFTILNEQETKDYRALRGAARQQRASAIANRPPVVVRASEDRKRRLDDTGTESNVEKSPPPSKAKTEKAEEEKSVVSVASGSSSDKMKTEEEEKDAVSAVSNSSSLEIKAEEEEKSTSDSPPSRKRDREKTDEATESPVKAVKCEDGQSVH